MREPSSSRWRRADHRQLVDVLTPHAQSRDQGRAAEWSEAVAGEEAYGPLVLLHGLQVASDCAVGGEALEPSTHEQVRRPGAAASRRHVDVKMRRPPVVVESSVTTSVPCRLATAESISARAKNETGLGRR